MFEKLRERLAILLLSKEDRKNLTLGRETAYKQKKQREADRYCSNCEHLAHQGKCNEVLVHDPFLESDKCDCFGPIWTFLEKNN